MLALTHVMRPLHAEGPEPSPMSHGSLQVEGLEEGNDVGVGVGAGTHLSKAVGEAVGEAVVG